MLHVKSYTVHCDRPNWADVIMTLSDGSRLKVPVARDGRYDLRSAHDRRMVAHKGIEELNIRGWSLDLFDATEQR